MSVSLGTILSRIDEENEDIPEKAANHRLNDHSRSKKTNTERRREGFDSINSGEYGVPGESTTALVEDRGYRKPKECWGTRHTLGFMGLLGVGAVYGMRVNLSVAIVAMVKYKPENYTNTTDLSKVCPVPAGQNHSSDPDHEGGDFDWDEATQGIILSVFYYGYLVTNLIGGRAAEIFGGKFVFGWGIFLTGIFTLLSPLAASVSTGLFIAIRVLEGLSEGVTFPAMNSLLAHWIPPTEKGLFSSIVFAGSQIGTVITMVVTGYLCDTDFLGGWPSVFYLFGGLGVLWSFVWYYLVYSYPDMHPRITPEEKAYIKHCCGPTAEKSLPVPWKSIFTSVPFWATLTAHVGYNWGYYTLLTELPTYLKNIQHFDMKSNGFWSALPYFVMWVVTLIYSQFMKQLLEMGSMTTIKVRRLSMFIGMYGPMAGVIAMCFVDCNTDLALVVLCIAVGICGPIFSGYMCSHQDISPNFAGTLMGITNSVATIPGIVAPSITGLITNGNQTLPAWRTVFIISAVVYFVAGTIYLVFISADVQPWNTPREDKSEDCEGKETKKRY